MWDWCSKPPYVSKGFLSKASTANRDHWVLIRPTKRVQQTQDMVAGTTTWQYFTTQRSIQSLSATRKNHLVAFMREVITSALKHKRGR